MGRKKVVSIPHFKKNWRNRRYLFVKNNFQDLEVSGVRPDDHDALLILGVLQPDVQNPVFVLKHFWSEIIIGNDKLVRLELI